MRSLTLTKTIKRLQAEPQKSSTPDPDPKKHRHCALRIAPCDRHHTESRITTTTPRASEGQGQGYRYRHTRANKGPQTDAAAVAAAHQAKRSLARTDPSSVIHPLCPCILPASPPMPWNKALGPHPFPLSSASLLCPRPFPPLPHRLHMPLWIQLNRGRRTVSPTYLRISRATSDYLRNPAQSPTVSASPAPSPTYLRISRAGANSPAAAAARSLMNLSTS